MSSECSGETASEGLWCRPIGFVRTAMKVKFSAPHQPDVGDGTTSLVVLNGGCGFENALRDIEGFDRIWLLCWMHKNASWRPLVLPPRGRSQRRGVFATRSPHRPNPISLTAVRLLGVVGLQLVIGENDLLDGTPVLDIKPYLPAVDSFPEAANGWVGEVERELAEPPRFEVRCSALVEEQSQWLREAWNIDFMSRVCQILERDPTPHRTRRIARGKRLGEFILGCGPWRVIFCLDAELPETSVVTLLEIRPGYSRRLLFLEGWQHVPDRDAQVDFLMRWSAVYTDRT